jgi:glycogen operon protein
MGDEFGNTQLGNNNPYCQDNEIAWVNWSAIDKWHDLYDFTCDLIRLRQKHPILHCTNPIQIQDWRSYGYPDLSYHGSSPWKPDFTYESRFLGLLYCGAYAEDSYFYIAINMHWEALSYALPRLPKGMNWEIALATCEQSPSDDPLIIPARSIIVHIADVHIHAHTE